MEKRGLTGTFEETAHFQEIYQSLLAVCDQEGTLVLQDLHKHRDMDDSQTFFRRGTREYIFPPQHVSAREDGSWITNVNHGRYGSGIKQMFNFDETAVNGRIRIEYEDASRRPKLTVSDLLGNSELPRNVGKTLDEIFGITYSTKIPTLPGRADLALR